MKKTLPLLTSICYTTSIFNTYFITRQFDWILKYEYVFFNSYWNGFQKYSCPALALAAIGGENKACSGGNSGTTLQNKPWGASVAAGANSECDDGFFWQLISSMFISRKWEYEPIRQFKLFVLYVSCVHVIVEEAVRTAKVRRSSHRKNTSL